MKGLFQTDQQHVESDLAGFTPQLLFFVKRGCHDACYWLTHAITNESSGISSPILILPTIISGIPGWVRTFASRTNIRKQCFRAIKAGH